MIKQKHTQKQNNRGRPDIRPDIPLAGTWVTITLVPMKMMARWRIYMEKNPAKRNWVTNLGLYGYLTFDWARREPRMALIERFINTAIYGSNQITGQIYVRLITITECTITDVLRIPSGGADSVNPNLNSEVYNKMVGLYRPSSRAPS